MLALRTRCRPSIRFQRPAPQSINVCVDVLLSASGWVALHVRFGVWRFPGRRAQYTNLDGIDGCDSPGSSSVTTGIGTATGPTISMTATVVDDIIQSTDTRLAPLSTCSGLDISMIFSVHPRPNPWSLDVLLLECPTAPVRLGGVARELGGAWRFLREALSTNLDGIGGRELFDKYCSPRLRSIYRNRALSCHIYPD